MPVQTATSNFGWQNKFSTTLSSGITASDTTIPLTSLPTPSEGFLVIEPDSSTNWEVIYYTSKTGYYTSKTGSAVVCTSVASGRGQDDSTAQSHSAGATVRMDTTAGMFEVLQNMSAMTPGSAGGTAFASGWTLIPSTVPNTVTYNGNRSYTCVINSTDLTSYVSAGMRVRTTRTVAAPTQCTSLNGTTQYYSKSSPAGMTFTDDFVVSAWVKLSSYAAGNQTVVSRFNGTSGWQLNIQSTGQIELVGFNGGGANKSYLQSYQSLPLNKWVHVTAQLDMSSFTATTTTSYAMIDGVDIPVQVGRAGTNPTSLIQAGNLEIGSTNSGTAPFNGKIAQVAIFNAKVTQAIMQGYISQGLSGSETSLISAYSFNNSINDLNTTNANNLTANGSAVATNADSPFGGQADGTVSSTIDYGIITKISY
ncbi:MAG: LamG domain-containing protein, partial [Caulobacteraceae bacterium]|nr:LamG domain-containing protein [Caulobacteraceae bacterium]